MAATAREPEWRDHGRETVGSDGGPLALHVSATCYAGIELTPAVGGRQPRATMHSRAWSRILRLFSCKLTYRLSFS